MFPVGSEATVRFSVRNPTEEPWRGVTVRARLLDSQGKELARQPVAEAVDFGPRQRAASREVRFALPPGQSGIFRAQVEIRQHLGRDPGRQRS